MADKFVTSLGIEVEFSPVPPMLVDKINAAYKPPDPPYYEIKAATGATERHIHDETTVQTDEEKAALAEYRAETARREEAHDRALTRLMLLKGVKVALPTDDAWVKEQECLGVTVPADPTERRLHYIETCVVGTIDDIAVITRGVSKASGATEEQLAQADESFQHKVGDAGREEAQGAASAGNKADVVLQPKIRGGGRRIRSANEAK